MTRDAQTKSVRWLAWLAAVTLLAIPIVVIAVRLINAEDFETFVGRTAGSCYVASCRDG